jgi:methyl-accepting chemotaxis protein
MQLSISRLIALCASGLLLAAIALTTWMQLQIDRLDEQGHHLEQLSDALAAAQELRYNSAQIQQFYTDASLTQEREPQLEAQQHYAAAISLLSKLSPLLPTLSARLEGLRSPLAALNSAGEQMVRAYAGGKEAGDRAMADFDRRSSAVISAFSALSEPLNQAYQQQLSDTEALRESMKNSNLLAWGLVLVFMLGSLWLIAARVLPPVRHLTQALRALNDGTGDLRRSVQQNHDDEVGEVVVQFNLFVSNLRSQMATVGEVSSALERSAEQLVSDAGASERSACDLQVEVEQVAAAVNQMASTVQDVASNAQASSERTRDADSQAQAAIGVVDKTIVDIRALAEEVGRAAQVIADLEGHSREIGGVLEVIRTIAEQTNLLALNAAIEAARAGEQGRGFAVVADEVRTLASRTQKSTQEINGMIERLQNASQQAVKVMDDSRDFAERGVVQALSAGEALKSISNLVSSVSGMSLHIAEAANEQAAVTDEINRRISTVSVVAHSTVALAESTLNRGRASGEDAERLLQIVRQFKF